MKIIKQKSGITLIALVVTIVVLLILAGVSISMLTGENGIISQAQKAKEQNEIGKEKEYINLAFTTVKGAKIANGDNSDVTSAELQEEINNYTNEATVTGTGILKITYTSGREYEVDGNGNITSSKSYDGMYSVGDLEGKIAPEDLFEYEIIDEQNKTARIVGIKAKYCNIEGYNIATDEYDVADTNGDIIYKGQKISDILVIPYEVTINGTKYLIKEANISAIRIEMVSSITAYNMTLPNVKWIVYPNTIEKMEYYEQRDQWLNNDYNRYSIVEDITFSDNIKTISAGMLNNTSWYESQPDGDLYINNLYYEYKGEMPENTSIIIKEGTTEIVEYAFEGCSSLTSITIPDSVTSIGKSAFEYCNSLESITIPDSVTSIGYGAFNETAWYNNQPNGEVYIGKVLYNYKGEMPENTSITIREGTKQIVDDAFYRCSSLTSITIPDSVTSIGSSAFSGCTGLTSITIPECVTSIVSNTFSGCSSLINITIPDSVTSIGEYAFSGCSSLTSITIPDSVTSIGSYAFKNCRSLTSITIPNSVTSIGSSPFYGTGWYENQPDGDVYIGKVYYTYKGEMPENTSIIIKEGTTEIVGYAFEGCNNLTSITIPESVTSIGHSTFEGCNNLTSITIPNSVTSIGDSTFEGCNNLTSITIPNSVTSIGDSTFEGCNNLTSITIPDSVTSIGEYAFSGCSSLTSITIPDSVTSIGYSTFEGCNNLTSITIPDSVTSIGNSAFNGTGWYNNQPNGEVYIGKIFYKYKGEMPENTSIIIKEGTTEIVGSAFSECDGLTSITIPESVTSIGSSAFSRCTGLTSITIPESVTSIVSNTFFGCSSLTSITIPDSVTRIGFGVFNGCNSLTSINIKKEENSISGAPWGASNATVNWNYTGE